MFQGVNVFDRLSSCQDGLYFKFNKLNPAVGYLCTIPVAILDVGIEILKPALAVIENLAFAIANLVRAAFDEKYTLKDALTCTESAIIHLEPFLGF